MRISVVSFSLLISVCGFAQSVASLNFNHRYDPANEIDFRTALTRHDNQMVVHYSIQLMRSSDTRNYAITWESRESYSDRNGQVLRTDTLTLKVGETKTGYLSVKETENPWILLAAITSQADQSTQYYAQVVEANYPVFAAIRGPDDKIVPPYLKTGEDFELSGLLSPKTVYAYHYQTDFPSALPPFSTRPGAADPVMLPDSSFSFQSDGTMRMNEEGLYLFQVDTTKNQGLAVRVESGAFPRYSRIDELVGPLIYVSTQGEFNQLLSTNGDKAKFDRIILDITRDKSRAKDFMRSYYRRVELANRYFTSFKQGWKTDRGMIYIIFGPPDNVSLGSQTEIWFYKDSRTRFIFLKAGSIYDPEYFVLQRSRSYSELWYNTIDLWRKSRF